MYFILCVSNTNTELCFHQKADFSAARHHCCGISYLYLHDKQLLALCLKRWCWNIWSKQLVCQLRTVLNLSEGVR